MRAVCHPASCRGLFLRQPTERKWVPCTGESVEAVSAFLDHSSLAVTSVHLRRLEGATDQAWPDVAVAIGV